MFVCGIAPARSEGTYTAWGHSTIVNPWGTVIATTDHEQAVVVTEIDLQLVEEIREQIPVLKQRRILTSLELSNNKQ